MGAGVVVAVAAVVVEDTGVVVVVVVVVVVDRMVVVGRGAVVVVAFGGLRVTAHLAPCSVSGWASGTCAAVMPGPDHQHPHDAGSARATKKSRVQPVA